MSVRRPARLSSQIRDEISLIISQGLRDPRIGFVTITDVSLSPDLKRAKVYVTVLGSDRDRAASLEGLNHAVGYIRHRIGERLQLRRIPELFFLIDESIAYGERIDKLLEDVHQREAQQASGEEPEAKSEERRAKSEE
jgi:ribosome-binding factor A